VAQAIPRAKLIYIMREPVARAHSHYAQRIQTAQNLGQIRAVPRTFEEEIEKTSELIDSSDYLMQIQQYLRFFSRDACLFLIFEELLQAPAENLQRIFQFLEVEQSLDVIRGAAAAENVGSDHRKRVVRWQISEAVKRMPGAAALFQQLPKAWREALYEMLRRTPFGRSIAKKLTPPPMRPVTRRKLQAHFDARNRALERFLGRDLSLWRTKSSGG